MTKDCFGAKQQKPNRRGRQRLYALNTKVEPDAKVIQPRSLNSKSWKNKQCSVILIACSQLWAVCVCASLLFGPCTETVFIKFLHRRPGLRTKPCAHLGKGLGWRGGLTLSRHETVLLSCVQPHETPRVSADAHRQSALLNKSTTGGDVETHNGWSNSRARERLASSVFISPQSGKDFLSLWIYEVHSVLGCWKWCQNKTVPINWFTSNCPCRTLSQRHALSLTDSKCTLKPRGVF